LRTREFEKLVAVLQERKAQIERNLMEAAREVESAGEAEAIDEGDLASIGADTQTEVLIAEQQLCELREIEHALAKVKLGAFGICEMCGEKIGIERLRVKPHAKYCIVCREAYEKNLSNLRHTPHRENTHTANFSY
jgi:DnaK suppressor protein